MVQPVEVKLSTLSGACVINVDLRRFMTKELLCLWCCGTYKVMLTSTVIYSIA